MQVTGQILSVTPRIDNNTHAQMFWQAHGKTFYTFDMVVQGPSGQVSGEISSITPNVYPRSAGEQITVQPSMQNGFPKLKAISEQNRQPQQQGGQTNYPPQQQAPPSQQRPHQDNRQDDIRFAQALNRACEEYNHGKIEETGIEERTNIYYRILQNRAFPMKMGHGQEQGQPPQQQAPPQQNQAPAQDFDSPPFNPTDDIPF